MFFRKLRSRSKSTSKSDKPAINRIASAASSQGNTMHSKVPNVLVSAATGTDLSPGPPERSDDEERDYQEFLEKARRDAEKAEKKKLRELKAAREVNLSPWGNRM